MGSYRALFSSVGNNRQQFGFFSEAWMFTASTNPAGRWASPLPKINLRWQLPAWLPRRLIQHWYILKKNVLKKAGKLFGEHTSLLRMKYVRTCPETWLEPSLGANLSCTYLAPGLNLSYTLLTPDLDMAGVRPGRHLSRIFNPTGSTGGGVT